MSGVGKACDAVCVFLLNLRYFLGYHVMVNKVVYKINLRVGYQRPTVPRKPKSLRWCHCAYMYLRLMKTTLHAETQWRLRAARVGAKKPPRDGLWPEVLAVVGRRSGKGSPLAESRGTAAVGGLEEEVPPEAEIFCLNNNIYFAKGQVRRAKAHPSWQPY